jgi:oxygen-dependent protoporphyrinogen oxidase
VNQLRTRVAVVGGGIAGLTAAYRLQQAGVDYRLIEAEPQLGGKIRTESVDGFLIEGGPDSFLAEKPWARQLCEELGLGGDIIGTNDAQRRIFLVSRGRLRPLPEGLVMLMPIRPLPLLRGRLLSARGVLRMAMEPLVPARRDSRDESLGAFVRRRFGPEVLERIVDPLLSGIYAGNSDMLSIDSTFPRLREQELTHQSVVRGLRSAQRQATLGPEAGPSMFLSLRGGMREMVDAMVRKLEPASLLTGTRTFDLTRDQLYRLRLSDGRLLSANSVVLAIPAFLSAQILDGADKELAGLLQQIPYVSTATISLAYRRNDVSHPLDGFGFVVPRVEKRGITACTWVSTKLPNRAPDHAALLRCFVGRAGDQAWVGLTDQELVTLARQELGELMEITAEPLFSRVFRWEKSMPQYRVGHQQLLQQIDARLAHWPGLFLTGSGYRGVGLPDCIHDADRIARATITEFVNGQTVVSPS